MPGRIEVVACAAHGGGIDRGDEQAVLVLDGLDLSVQPGEFVAILGRSGSGKSTLLHLLGGLDRPSAGKLEVDGQNLLKFNQSELTAYRREQVGFVWQQTARNLLPYLSARENIELLMTLAGRSRKEGRAWADELLDAVDMRDYAQQKPTQLSGGQQQRIALARAIVIEPDVLLLDEPLSALDANLREEMRVELKRIQRELGISTIFVTHDQSEALAMSDKVVVMSEGWIEQEGTPEQVYNEPASEFVANFLGISNIFSGHVTALSGGTARLAIDRGPELLAHPRGGRAAREGERVRLAVRAEKVFLSEGAPGEEAETVVLDGKVTAVDYQGQAARYFVEAGPLKLQAINPIDRRPFHEGQPVKLRIRAQDVVLLDADAHEGATAKAAAE